MASKTATIKSLKTGSYVMIDDEPCRVIDVTLSKPGKHGSAKARMDAVGIFDEKKRCVLKPADAACQIPIIEKKKGQVISLSGEYVQIMDLEDYSTFDANIPSEMKGKIEPGAEISYWRIGTRVLVKDAKEA